MLTPPVISTLIYAQRLQIKPLSSECADTLVCVTLLNVQMAKRPMVLTVWKMSVLLKPLRVMAERINALKQQAKDLH